MERSEIKKLLKHKVGKSVGVIIPARNEAVTLRPILRCIRQNLIETYPLVDELIVVDDHSEDATAQVANEERAKVVIAQAFNSLTSNSPGKGQALYKGLVNSFSDILIFIDSDVTNFSVDFILKLVKPLLEKKVAFVKASYTRFSKDLSDSGGRITELSAKPLLKILGSGLCRLKQPLAGEYGAPRSVLENLRFSHGFGVDIGLLIDFEKIYGENHIVEVDLGERLHRNKPLLDLRQGAIEVIGTILSFTNTLSLPEELEFDKNLTATLRYYGPIANTTN